MDALSQLKAFKTDLDNELATYLKVKIKEASSISPDAEDLMKHVSDLTLRGGKRIRAALLYYSYLAHGGKNKKAALKAAMSMEMSESYLLIHDDIIDDGALRRGGTTIHLIYKRVCENKYSDKANPKDFGNSIGILAGDIAAALSNELISCADFSPFCKVTALSELNAIYAKEIYGQTLDILAGLSDKINKENVLLIHKLKTVPYTFDGPVKIGAILAGACKPEYLEKLGKYTLPLGIAFQIQDDVLGMFGSEEKLGKSVTSDLKEGKKTLLILDALEKADKVQAEILNLNLGNKNATIQSLKNVRKVIEETGALEKSKKTATDLVQESINALEKLRLKKEGKEFLLGIAEYMVKREY